MCGIAGILTQRPEAAQLRQMANVLQHRGPDDSGIYIGEGIGLASTRLSIVDIAGGHQPLSNGDESVWLVYNGEIYNAAELREQLTKVGHCFRSQSDTEVIVHGYEEWGDDVVVHLRGMFAFAVWDVNRRRLYLARDRFGIKPLFYASSASGFVFGSEIRSLLVGLKDLPRRANKEALWRLFELGFAPSPATFFEGIYKLPAGQILTIENGIQQTRTYWNLTRPVTGAHYEFNPKSAVEPFMQALLEAVEAWSVSDVPVGSMLSGGIDSTAVAALLSETKREKLHTFNVAFAEATHDESRFARETARRIGSQHHEVVYSGASFNYFPDVVRALEEPLRGGTTIVQYLMFKACHEAGFKVVMAGEGADELLGGYDCYRGDRLIRPFLGLPEIVRRCIATLSPGPPIIREYLVLHPSCATERYALWQRSGSDGQRRRLIKRSFAKGGEMWRRIYGEELRSHHPMDQFLMLESQTRLVDLINMRLDRMSMAHSVEARVPFLDHRLWEICARMPPVAKLNWKGDKLPLRLGMQDRLPKRTCHRPKKALSAPDAAWWRGKRLPEWAEECITSSALQDTGYFEADEVSELRAAHQSGRHNMSSLLTGVLTTQFWHREVLKGGIAHETS